MDAKKVLGNDLGLDAQPIDLEESKGSVESSGVNYMGGRGDCMCETRQSDELEKRKIQAEITYAYDETIQLEQALIELDKQNTLNALEIKKREVKVFIMQKQLEDMEEAFRDGKENVNDENDNDEQQMPNEMQFLKRHIEQHQ